MENPNLSFYIPQNEITDAASLLDAVKKRIIEYEINYGLGIFLKGTKKGICIQLVHPDFDCKN